MLLQQRLFVKQTGLPEGYGFIEFPSRAVADRILQNFNGTIMPNTEQTFRLNWATLGAGERRQDDGPDLYDFRPLDDRKDMGLSGLVKKLNDSTLVRGLILATYSNTKDPRARMIQLTNKLMQNKQYRCEWIPARRTEYSTFRGRSPTSKQVDSARSDTYGTDSTDIHRDMTPIHMPPPAQDPSMYYGVMLLLDMEIISNPVLTNSHSSGFMYLETGG
ncbi:hypothetical protein F8388_013144 [Cannabis sativa]|uniref:RRM domain-containing protein n=1 Tax=Cannabis sativa TaxID=3483 RepID=A0A7J6HLX5_CANSA|nr:hypothetical protein F8388_013144 [Cannabis sativa]